MKNLILKILYSVIGEINSNQLRVIIFHNIENNQEEKFEKLIKKLKETWNIITPSEFKDLTVNNNINIKKKNILITFDDGYKSQKIITEKYLDPLNIKALFFIVSDFIKLKTKNEAHNFIRKNFYKEERSELILDENTLNMSQEDIQELISNGHSIGGHTGTHAELSKIKNNNMFLDEIINSSLRLENIIQNYKIEDFAYTFGDLESIDEKSTKAILKNYKYLYSGLRGNNLNLNSKIIRRDAISLTEPFEVISAYLNGYTDFIYKTKIKKLEKWKL
tara:strand:- start:1860 stop:2690 length:831 start_codon:yes stop_codon:yes gene_type:complete